LKEKQQVIIKDYDEDDDEEEEEQMNLDLNESSPV